MNYLVINRELLNKGDTNMRIKITGHTRIPCPYEGDDKLTCDKCKDKPCDFNETKIARTRLGFYLKSFWMKVMHDWVEIDNV